MDSRPCMVSVVRMMRGVRFFILQQGGRPCPFDLPTGRELSLLTAHGNRMHPPERGLLVPAQPINRSHEIFWA